jgi:hypothetical protein
MTESTIRAAKAGSRRIALGAGKPATPTGAPTDIKLDLNAVARPVVAEPGEYLLRVREARAVPPVPKKSASVALGLYAVDEDGGETRLKSRPLWIWSREHPADNQPDLILTNRALLADVLRAAGREAPGDLARLVEALRGVEFIGYLTVQIDRATGEKCNELAEVLVPGDTA